MKGRSAAPPRRSADGDSDAAMKRASIKDIARLADVSHSTVSRALRGSGLISEETAGRIRRIAREAGYTPSAAARSLVTRRTDTIGVVVTNIADPFVAGVVSGIEEVASEKGHSVFLANSHADPEREVRVVAILRGAAGGRHHRHLFARGGDVRAAALADAGPHRAAE